MATKDEISGWIWDAREKYKSYKRTIADCDKQIARLEPVYKEIGELKSDFRNTRKSVEAVFTAKGSWQGERHSSFRNAGAAVDDICGAYYQRLDAAQDAVNQKIGKLRAKKQELVPIIGRLLAQIEQWEVDIENALN